MVRKNEYARMAEYEKTYWWHLGRLDIIRTYIGKALGSRAPKASILNVGCGTGGTIDMLEHFGTVKNVDISDEAIKFMNNLGYKDIVKVDDIVLPFKDRTFDMVGAFDVLEHIEDHLGALKEWKRVIKDDGAIVVTVPAYKWLWSAHDVSLYHKRRYTVRSLTKVAKEAGLRPQKKSYAIVFSLPLVAGFRMLNKVLGRKTDSETSYVKLSPAVNKLFTRLLQIEARMHRSVSFPAGTSVVAIFKKA
jgi:SAM-dependent methyltransferase